MKKKFNLKKYFLLPVLALFLATLTVFTPVTVYADPADNTTNASETTENTEMDESTDESETKNDATGSTTKTDTEDEDEDKDKDKDKDEDEDDEEETSCYDQTGAVGWVICPSSDLIAKATDALYSVIETFLQIRPLTSDTSSPIYLVWQYVRNITNIIFIILLLVVVWSQLTGIGINNYGIKKVLPRIIIAAVLVNLSYFICSIAIDTSNILGYSLRNFFLNIEKTVAASSDAVVISYTDLFTGLTTGAAVGGVIISVTGGLGAFFWMLIGVLIGAIIAVFTGLLTVSLRQAVIAILVMIAPLAFVAYLLPNTEKYFRKWKDTFIQMIIFYPMFSVLFGASELAGWTIISSANGSVLWIILGMAVRVIPLVFSIKLMQMSGTVLGEAGRFIGGFGNRINGAVQPMIGRRAEMSRNRYIVNSSNPGAHLRRYMDNRRMLQEKDIENSMRRRNSMANIASSKKIAGIVGYDKDGNPITKTNSYTRNAKLADTLDMESQTATLDSAHVLSSYDKYHGKTTSDVRLARRTGNSAFELRRATFTKINDDEADENYLVDRFMSAAYKGHDSYEYKHFIKSAAGGLGEKGTESVLAQVLNESSKQESRHRHDTAILINKFGHNKSYFRSMMAGYKVDDNGIALDRDGNQIESQPGELLKNDPSKLVPYETMTDDRLGDSPLVDENGEIFMNILDDKGNFITRIYKHDSPAMKEILSNFDMTINDPINGFYGVLAGIYEGDYTNVGLANVGLAKYRTTIARGALSARFKEKAAYASPYWTTMVSQGYIQNYCHQNLARLDSLGKTAKPGNFNTQDKAEFKQIAKLINPDNWNEDWFPEDALRTFKNVNGEHLHGTRYILNDDGSYALDENNERITQTVDVEQATYEELMNTVRAEYLFPTIKKITTMMARGNTQSTIDNLKPGTAKEIDNIHKQLERISSEEEIKNLGGYIDPLKPQDDDARSTFREINQAITPNPHKRHGGGSGSGDGGNSGDNGGDGSSDNGGTPPNTPPSGGSGGGSNPPRQPNDNPIPPSADLRDRLKDVTSDVNQELLEHIRDLADVNPYSPRDFAEEALGYLDENVHRSEIARYVADDLATYMDELSDENTDKIYEFIVDAFNSYG